MSEVTEGDLMAAIMEDYRATQLQPGDVTVAALLREMRKINPDATLEQAEYQHNEYSKREGVQKVYVKVNGRSVAALRRKTPPG